MHGGEELGARLRLLGILDYVVRDEVSHGSIPVFLPELDHGLHDSPLAFDRSEQTDDHRDLCGRELLGLKQIQQTGGVFPRIHYSEILEVGLSGSR